MQDFVIEDGVLVRYNGTDATVCVPEEVTAIGEYCFQGNKTLRSIHLPESFREIRAYAFDGCTLDYIYGSGCCAFLPHSLKNCTVQHVYVGWPTFYETSAFRNGIVHSHKNCRDVWDFCYGHRPAIRWKGDFEVFHAEQVRAKIKEHLPGLIQARVDYKKAHRVTLYMNRVAVEGIPYWLGALIFLLVLVTAGRFCQDMPVLQQYFLKYIVPVAAGVLSLVAVKIIRLIWKTVRFHNKDSKACIVRDTLAEINAQIDIWHPLSVQYSDLELLRMKSEVPKLEAEFYVHCNGISESTYNAVISEQKNNQEKEWDGTDWDGTVWGIGN